MKFGVHNLEKSLLDEIGKMDFIVEWLKPMLRPGLLVVIEGFAFAARGNAVVQLAGLQYLVRHLLFNKQIPFKLVTPNQAKKFLTGKQNVDKNVILKEVFKRYKLDVDDDNIADAINLNKIGQALLGLIEIGNQAQREVVEELLNGRAVKKKRGKKPATA
jgi:crossover junction endodeoxyribonuclease RuvC